MKSAQAQREAPAFLIAYGGTFLITAIRRFFLPRPTTALIAMFQGGVRASACLLAGAKAGRPADVP